MSRAYYSAPISQFASADPQAILGTLAQYHGFALDLQQRNSWIEQIRILQDSLTGVDGHILLEYSIPRMGKRVDAVVLTGGIVLVLEFKVGEREYKQHAVDQVVDYGLDLKNFHEQSHRRAIIPILVATEAGLTVNVVRAYEDRLFHCLFANKQNLRSVIDQVRESLSEPIIDPLAWENSIYRPTPTIIEAAQALYQGHSVREIARSDAGGANLSETSDAILRIVERSKRNGEKAIVFITGVPGAGKTLAGLNIANARLGTMEGDHAVFLSGNGPLVQVLCEALARDSVAGHGQTKSAALMEARAFIQNVHHFRDDALSSDLPPVERIVIFDEAQRAWTREQTAAFMKQKRGISDFGMSEPAFLISVMDRRPDWAVIVCLVGGGQEINTGEAGLPEWFRALNQSFPEWRVHSSDTLTDFEYTQGQDLFGLVDPSHLMIDHALHLAVSQRSFRAESVSSLVKALLDLEMETAREFWAEVRDKYPIVLTRNLDHARYWLRSKARGTERYGLLASSGAHRLKPCGINVQARIGVIDWLLNAKDDVRSSFYLEDVATEFDIQGLELDWTCVGWDADLRLTGNGWSFKDFRGTAWQDVKDDNRRLFLKNAYRVLLTRARQGMVIFVPTGSQDDPTRTPAFYDGTFEYLRAIGFPCLE